MIHTYRSGIQLSFQSYTEICLKLNENEPTEPFQGADLEQPSLILSLGDLKVRDVHMHLIYLLS